MSRTKYAVNSAVARRFVEWYAAKVEEEGYHELRLRDVTAFLSGENIYRPVRELESMINILQTDGYDRLAAQVGMAIAHEYGGLREKWENLSSAFSPIVEAEIDWQVEHGMLMRGED